MLEWTPDREGLRADGYCIRSQAPFRWILSKDAPSTNRAVQVLSPPLATTRTLGEAKREAELHLAALHRAEAMHRRLVSLILSIGGSVFAVGAPAPWNFFLTLGLTTLGLRAAGFMLGLLLAPWVASVDDLFYQ